MSTRPRASFRRRVMSSSAWLGSSTPEGWVCAEMTAAALCSSVWRRTARGGRAAGWSVPQHLPGMPSGAVDGAAKHLLEGDEPVPIVEVQAAYLYPGDTARRPRTKPPILDR